MLSRAYSAALHGIEGYRVTVEVDFRPGLPSFTIVGLPDAAVKESRERVIAAIKNSGFEIPLQRMTVNLAPAHLKKEGASFDLAIAIAILAAGGTLGSEQLSSVAFLGELGLDGAVRAVTGTLPCVLGLKARGIRRVIVPDGNATEAAVVDGIDIHPVRSLADSVNLIVGESAPPPFKLDRAAIFQSSAGYEVDFSHVKGQRAAKRALEIAAAGGHNVLLIGPPGSGKTLLARRLPTILPDLTFEEALETTKIHSVAGLLRHRQTLVATRPFRSPHHQISDVALIGGGANPRPGEVSLSHRGVLFLDEFPEFGRAVLEALRQPLEDRRVTVVRVASAVTYPADFLLVAAANPCPCGYFGSFVRECTCPPPVRARYRAKFSGPLMDRIDLHVEVPALTVPEILDSAPPAESSLAIRARIQSARKRQSDRLREAGLFENGQMNVRQIRRFCPLDAAGRSLIERAVNRIGLSARSVDRVRRVARTIADLEGEDNVSAAHLAEAVGYRGLDRTDSGDEARRF